MEPPDRLSGWKEIAQHFGKSVRTIQRWERDHDLPVQRLRTEKGSVVFASRRELDQWRTRLTVLPAEISVAESVTGEGDDREELSSSRIDDREEQKNPGIDGRLWGLAGGIAALVLAVVGLFFWKPQATHASEAPLTLEFNNRRLEAKDPSGAVRWVHDFGGPVLSALHTVSPWVSLEFQQAQRVVHLLPIRRLDGTDDTLYVFDNDGSVLRTVTAGRAFECAGIDRSQAWRFGGLAVSSSQEPRRIWASFNHESGRLGIVMEISSDQPDAVIRYLQAGPVMALTEWHTANGINLAAGGKLDTEQRPSLALIDIASPVPASAPQSICDIGNPVAVSQLTLLPSLNMAEVGDRPSAAVDFLAVVGDELKVAFAHRLFLFIVGADGVVGRSFLDDICGGSAATSPYRPECAMLSVPAEVRTWKPEVGWNTTVITPERSSRGPQLP